MPRFASFDGTRLAYELEGDAAAPPILMLHGFAADSYVNWVRPGLASRLASSGRRVILLDQRGHGLSDSPHDPAAYGGDNMSGDAIAMLDELGIERADVCGYSMGAWLTLGLLTAHDRFRSAVLGGIGGGRMAGAEAAPASNPIADALLAPDKSVITNPIGRSFRDFADLTGADKEALAALQRAPNRALGRAEGVENIKIPVLVICGDTDNLAPDPQALADRIPGAKAVVVPGTHLNVVNNPAYHEAVLEFLASVA